MGAKRRSPARSSSPLANKLNAAFLQYDLASMYLLLNFHWAGGRSPLTSGELQDFLEAGGALAFTDGEKQALHAQQLGEANRARVQNAGSSVLDLDSLRSKNEVLVRQFAEEVPKGALLHTHPSGTRSLATVRSILERANPLIDLKKDVTDARGPHQTITKQEEARFAAFPVKRFRDLSYSEASYYLSLFTLDPDKTYPFSRFDTLFQIDDILTDDPIYGAWAWEKTYFDFIDQCRALNVSYVEFTRGLMEYGFPEPERTRVFDRTLTEFEQWAARWEAEGKQDRKHVIARWNMAFKRFRSDASNSQRFEVFARLLNARPSGVVRGIDLLASEKGFPALERAQNLYIRANDPTHGLQQTMHAGELGDDPNPRDAILLGAERIGHGVRLRDDPVTLEYNRRIANVGVVANVTSNQMLRAHADVSTHPFLFYLRLGIPTSLSTDNPGIFQTTIADDYYRVITETDIVYTELRQLAFNGINLGFANPLDKAELVRDLDQRFTALEQTWSGRI